MKRTFLAVTIILAVLALVNGGNDAVDINRMVFVVGIGIDTAEQGYAYTIYTAVPSGADNTVSENKVSYEHITLTAGTMSEAMRRFERNSSRELSLEHLNCCAIGSSAKNENIPLLLDYLLRDPTVRRQCTLLLVDGSAKEFFSIKQNGSVASVAAALLEQQSDSGNRNSIMTLGRLRGTVNDRSGFSLYVLGITDNKSTVSASDVSAPVQIAVNGLAVYNQSGFGGIIDSSKAELARLFQPQQSSGILTAVDENGNSFHYEITRSRCLRSFTPEHPVKGSFDIAVECILVESEGDNVRPPDEKELEQALHQQLSAVMDDSRLYGASLVGMDREARQAHRLWYIDNMDRFDSLYRSARLELRVECDIEQRSD